MTEFLEKAFSYSFNQPLILIIVLNIFMLIASYTDIKYLKIYDKFNLTMMITRIISMIILFIMKEITLTQIGLYFIGGIVMFLMFFIPAMITINPIGGDIKFAFNIGLFVGLQAGLLIGCIATILNLIYRIFFTRKKDKEDCSQVIMNVPISFTAKKVLPLGPFLYIGYIALFCIFKLI